MPPDFPADRFLSSRGIRCPALHWGKPTRPNRTSLSKWKNCVHPIRQLHFGPDCPPHGGETQQAPAHWLPTPSSVLAPWHRPVSRVPTQRRSPPWVSPSYSLSPAGPILAAC